MMNDKATVTMPLEDFDELREESAAFRTIRAQIAKCFTDYQYVEFAEPEECKKCTEENPNCTKCEIGKENPPYEESITLDVEQLISVCKQYALFGKNVDTDIRDLKIIKKSEKGKDKKPKSAPRKPKPAKKSTVAALSLGGKPK